MGEKKIETTQVQGFLSLEGASAFLAGMPIETIKQKVYLGKLKAYKPGRSLMFDPKDLIEFVKRHRK